MRESRDAKRARARKIIRALKKAYPDAKIALDFGNPLELLVATILSAQCTDERVNQVTPALFKKYYAAGEFVAACTIASTPATASAMPSPVARSPAIHATRASGRGRRARTRTR